MAIFTLVVVIDSVTATFVFRIQIKEIKAENDEVRPVCRRFNAIHQHLTELATFDELSIWNSRIKKAPEYLHNSMKINTLVSKYQELWKL